MIFALFQEGASQFQQQAVKLKKKSWWENLKVWIIMGIVVLALITIMVIFKSGRESPSLNTEVVGNSNIVPEIPIPNTGGGEAWRGPTLNGSVPVAA